LVYNKNVSISIYRVLIVIKCEVISPTLDSEISEIKVKPEENEVHVKLEVKDKASDGTVSKSALRVCMNNMESMYIVMLSFCCVRYFFLF
jgi:hypothetical protein